MATNERAILGNLNRRARFYGGNDAPQLDVEDIFGILAFYGRQSCKSGEPAFSFDHVKPLKLGGENIPENIQLLTEDENKAKRDEEIDYRNGNICTREWLEQWKQEQNEAKGVGAFSSKSQEQQDKRTYKRHDWDALQFEYVTTDLSLRDLADKHNMDASLILKRAASERWLKEREKFAINLLSDVQKEAQKAEVSSRVMILEAARIALEEWKANDEPTRLDDLSKILELAARIEGYELNKSSVTVKDWRDVGREAGADPDELEQYFTTLEGGHVQGVESEQGAGWTD